jgi:hypothetical protein
MMRINTKTKSLIAVVVVFLFAGAIIAAARIRAWAGVHHVVVHFPVGLALMGLDFWLAI